MNREKRVSTPVMLVLSKGTLSEYQLLWALNLVGIKLRRYQGDLSLKCYWIGKVF